MFWQIWSWLTAGMFYWIQSLQTYDKGWSYIENLQDFVWGGMVDDTFIDAVSGESFVMDTY